MLQAEIQVPLISHSKQLCKGGRHGVCVSLCLCYLPVYQVQHDLENVYLLQSQTDCLSLTKDIALSLNILEVVTKPIFSPALPKPEKSQTSCPLCQCVFGILTQETYLHLLRNTHPLDFNTVS